MDIRVDGAVARSGTVSLEELRRMEQADLTFDFTCLEGWCRPGTRWSGVSVRSLLAPFIPLPEGRYLEIASGDFVAVVPMDEAREGGLFALESEGVPLDGANGGPVRFVIREADCFANVKAVDRVRVALTPDGETARGIALGRIGRA